MTGDHLPARVLHDHADGLLAPAEAGAVDDHLVGCPACRVELAAIRQLRAAAAALPDSIDPGVDLRPAIRAERRRRDAVEDAGGRRLAPGTRARRVTRRRTLAAAAALLIGISSVLTTWWLVERRDASSDAPVAAASGTAEASATVLALDREYARAGAELRESVEAASARLAPETLRLLRTNMAAVDRALAESRAALLEDPGSPVLRELVLTAHRQRLDVLRQAAALATES